MGDQYEEEDRELSPEEEAELESLGDDLQLRHRLWALMEPPADLSVRIDEQVQARLLGRDTLMAALDLLRLGWLTTKVIVAPEDT